MTKVLQIDSSIFGSNGNSSQLTAKFVQQLQEAAEKIEVTYRNVGVSDFPHYSAQTVEDVGAGCAELADLLIAEVQTADILVLGVPMYNFGVPSQLKSWFDHIARAGSTFKYTESGPVGLLQNKKAYVLAAHGGLHHEAQSTDVESEFLKTFLGFVGITDQSFIYADGLNMAQHSEANRARAEQEISEAVKALAASLGRV